MNLYGSNGYVDGGNQTITLDGGNRDVYTINTLTLLNETTVDSVSDDYYTSYNFHVCG